MDNYDFDERPTKSNIFFHTGFRMGGIGFLLMVLVRSFFLLIQPDKVDGNIAVWLIQWALYLLLARTAAQQHYDGQERNMDALHGVTGAGVGAALVTSISIWFFIVIVAVIMDANDVQIFMEPISVCGWVVLDVIIALGLGSWGGRMVANQFKNFTHWE